MPVMPPGRGRMVCKASLWRTLQDVTEAVQGAATLRQRRGTQHPPCHSTSQRCPDTAPPRDKALAADSGPALLGCICPWEEGGGTSCRETAHPSLSLAACMETELLHPQGQTGTSSLCFDIFSAHDLKDHCPRAESDGDVLRNATANVHCTFCLKYRYQEFFVWSHCLAKELHSCQSVDELSWERGIVPTPGTKSKLYLHPQKCSFTLPDPPILRRTPRWRGWALHVHAQEKNRENKQNTPPSSTYVRSERECRLSLEDWIYGFRKT